MNTQEPIQIAREAVREALGTDVAIAPSVVFSISLAQIIVMIERGIQMATENDELIVESVTDDGETFTGVRCPVCKELLSDSDSVYAVDSAIRWSPISFDEEHFRLEISPGDCEFGATDRYIHHSGDGEEHVYTATGWEEVWA